MNTRFNVYSSQYSNFFGENQKKIMKPAFYIPLMSDNITREDTTELIHFFVERI